MRGIKLKIRGKLIASFLLLIGIFLSVGSLVYFDSAKIFLLVTKIDGETTQVLQASKELEANFKKIQEYFASAISFTDEEVLEKAVQLSASVRTQLESLKMKEKEAQTALNEISPLFERYSESGESIYKAMTSGNSVSGISDRLRDFGNLSKILDSHFLKFRLAREAVLENEVQDIRSLAQKIQFAILLIAGITTFSGISIAFIMARTIVNPLKEMSDTAKDIAQGKFPPMLQVSGDDEITALSKSFNIMVSGLKKADEQRLKVAQISAMVETAPYGMMFADNTFKITYMNPASLQMFKRLEHLLPCRADEILGQVIDVFHSNPENIRKILSDPKKLPHRAQLKYGDEVIDLSVSAVFDENGVRIGTFTAWEFVTQESRVLDTLRETMAALSFEAGHLSDSSRQMSDYLESVGKKASCAGTTSKETTGNVEVVASSSGELASTVKEISRNVQEASQISAQAVDKAHHANSTISKLGESSVEIGKVIQVISSIAAQTKQLALNATIEAARSGESGKGFSVVANEVKALARQTSEATSEIQRRISAIQESTEEAVVAIEEISAIITKSSEIATSIAGAIEEQAVTTSEISSSASEAAQGALEVVDTVNEISSATHETSKEAEQVLMASNNLSELAKNLRGLIENLTNKK